MSERCRVGTIGCPVQRKKLYLEVDWVELSEYSVSLPRVSTAKSLRKEAPGHVSFSVQLPRYLFETPPLGAPLPGSRESYGGFKPTPENKKLFENALAVADALESAVLVLATPAELTPALPMKEALSSFISEAPLCGRTLVWQPSGPWEASQAAAFAKRNGIVLAVDPLRDEPPEGKLAYLRLGPFSAMGSRVGMYDLERIMESASGFDRSVVVFGTPRALDDARSLKKLLAGAEQD